MSVDRKDESVASGVASRTQWIPLAEVSQSGAYVVRDTGDLLRIPDHSGLSEDEGPFGKNANRSVTVARLSDDPFIPITKARLAAAALDIEISF